MRLVTLFSFFVLSGYHLLLAQVLSLRDYTQDDGLLSNGVSAIAQTSDGYLWIGTGEGLSRFDGTSFTNYRTNDGLPSNYITVLTPGKRSPGRLWIGTRHGGLCKFDSGQFTRIPLDSINPATHPPAPLVTNLVEAIVEREGGDVWAATRMGIYRIVGDKKALVYPLTVRGLEVNLVSTPGGLVIGSADDSIYVFTGEGSLRERFSLGRPGRRYITVVFADQEGSVWVGTSDSLLFRLRDSTIVQERPLLYGSAGQIIEDAGDLWIATSNGILQLSRKDFASAHLRRYSRANGFPSDHVVTEFIDHEGNFWFGFWERGIMKWSNRHVLSFPFADIPSAYNNSRAVNDRLGHIWVLTGKHVAEVWSEPGVGWEITHHQLPDDLGGVPRTIVIDRDGRLWMNFRDGIRSFQSVRTGRGLTKLQVQRTLMSDSRLSTDYIACFIIDSRGRLWCCVDGTGVAVFDLKTMRHIRTFSLKDGLPDLTVRTLYEDHHGRVWIGGFLWGLAIAPPDIDETSRLRLMTMRDGLPDDEIRSFMEDSSGAVFVGTRFGGLAIIHDSTIHTLTTKDELISNTVWSMCKSAAGGIWLGTSRGVQEVDGATMRPVADKLQLMPSHMVSITGCGDVTGKYLWLVSTDGLTIIERNSADRNFLTPPPVYIHRCEINGNPVSDWKEILLPSNQNNISFAFIGISFRGENATRYQHRLQPPDRDWQRSTTEHLVSFASLRPGSYTFDVRAINADGLVSVHPARISFTILPPLWETWWFRIGIVAGMFIITLVTYRIRLSKLNKEETTRRQFTAQLLMTQEQERARIAGELHDSLGQDLLVIRNRALIGLRDGALTKNVRDQFDQISSVAMSAVDGVREISYNLRPYQFDRLGLTKAITSIASRLATSVRFSMAVDPIDDEIGKDHAIHVYRIVQEGINNILKHASATEAQVTIRAETGNLRITISDNGKGIPADQSTHPPARRGFGLAGMTERAKVLNGAVTIESTPGKGTVLTVLIPRLKKPS